LLRKGKLCASLAFSPPKGGTQNFFAFWVSIGGRALNSTGRGVFGARVVLTDASGNIRYAETNPFGYYRFAQVSAGATYILTAAHKSCEFAPRVVFVSEEFNEFNFVSASESPLGSGF